MADEIVGIHLQVEGGAQANKTAQELAEELRKAEQSAAQVAKTFGENSKQAEIARDRVSKITAEFKAAKDAAAGLGDGVAKTEAPMKSMRTQIREALQNLVQMQDTFGDISPEAEKAAKHLADLRDRLKDANEVAQLFDPEKKFQVIANVGQGIASGFTAATGAMALLGIESEDVQKTLLKVQAAMALSQGLSGVIASVEDFRRLGGVLANIGIVQKVNAIANTLAAATMRAFGVATVETGVAFNVLKGAIIGTGIGVLVVAIGLLVSKIMDWTSSTNTQEAAQKRLNSALERQDEILKGQLSDIDYFKKLALDKAKIAGASADELYNIGQKYRDKELDALIEDQRVKARLSKAAQVDDKLKEEDKKKARDENVKAYEAVVAKEREIALAHLDDDVRVADERRKDQKEASDKAEAASKAAGEKAIAARKADMTKIASLEKQFSDDSFARTHTAEEADLRAAGLRFADLLKLYEKYGYDTTNITANYNAEVAAIEDKHAKDRADKQAKLQQDAVTAQIKEDEDDAKQIQDRVAAEKSLVDLTVTNQKIGFDTKRAMLEAEHQAAIDSAQETGRSVTEIDAEFAEARKKIAISERETKVRELQAVSGALDGFAQLAGEQTAAGKAFAIASATIQAILGAQQAFTALSAIPIVGPALGAIAAAGAIAMGIANIKKIAAVQIPGGNSGGSASTLGLSAQAPLSPQAAQQQPVKIDQQQVNSMGNATNKTYVLESDITDTQTRITRIQQAAKFQ